MLQLLPREKRKHEYQEAVKNRYKHLPEVKRIVRLVLCPTLMFRQSASYNFMTPSWDMCVYIHHTDLISFAFTIGKTFLISLSCHLVLIISAISYTVTRRKSIGKGFLNFDVWVCHCRHRHLPKPIFKAAALRRTIMDAERRKEERRKAHSAPGSISTVPLRRRRIIKEVE